VRCQKLQQVIEEQSFGFDTGPQLFCPVTHCLKSDQNFAVCVHQVTTVAMATTQLVLNQFKKNFLSYQFRIEESLSLPKIISKCCELVKLCDIIRSSLFF